jgi:hypothetical protein
VKNLIIISNFILSRYCTTNNYKSGMWYLSGLVHLVVR